MKIKSKAVVGASVASIIGLVVGGTAAYAGDNENEGTEKVFVCKYVDIPDVGERPQSGQNPIEVAVKSIPGWEGKDYDDSIIGMEFADRQGKSVVIAFSPERGDGQRDEPTIEDCLTIPEPLSGSECVMPLDGTEVAWTQEYAAVEVKGGGKPYIDYVLGEKVYGDPVASENPDCQILPPPPPPPSSPPKPTGVVNVACLSDMNIDVTYGAEPAVPWEFDIYIDGEFLKTLVDEDNDLMGFHPVIPASELPDGPYSYSIDARNGQTLHEAVLSGEVLSCPIDHEPYTEYGTEVTAVGGCTDDMDGTFATVTTETPWSEEWVWITDGYVSQGKVYGDPVVTTSYSKDPTCMTEPDPEPEPKPEPKTPVVPKGGAVPVPATPSFTG